MAQDGSYKMPAQEIAVPSTVQMPVNRKVSSASKVESTSGRLNT